MPTDALTMPTPIITTERLELFAPTYEDVAPMFAIMQHPDTWKHFGAPITIENHTLRFFRNAGSWALCGYGGFMVREKGRPELLGNCGIFHSWRGLGEDFDDNPEAGWIMSADHAGRGYASEAMTAVLAWFDRQHGPRRVTAMIAPENTASHRLAARLGFRVFRQVDFDGSPHDLLERPATTSIAQ